MADIPPAGGHPAEPPATGPPGSGLSDHEQAEPTVPRMWVGAQFRRLRMEKGITLEDAADYIRGSASKLSRLEQGRHRIKLRDAEDLLTLYQTDPAQRATLLALTRQASSPGWWQTFKDLIPDWYEPFLGQEQAASVIRTYDAQLVPALLQTPGYARAVIEASHHKAAKQELGRRVSLHMRRQDILRQADPPGLWSVIDEAALRRAVGGPNVMRAQIRKLIDAAELPRVRLQVLAFRSGAHPALQGAVTLLRMRESVLPDVVVLEQLDNARYVNRPADVEYYRHILDRLALIAEPAKFTSAILRRILHDT